MADNKRLFIKINATIADKRPIISSAGKAVNISNETGSKTNTGSTILILSAEKFEIIDEREISHDSFAYKSVPKHFIKISGGELDNLYNNQIQNNLIENAFRPGGNTLNKIKALQKAKQNKTPQEVIDSLEAKIKDDLDTVIEFHKKHKVYADFSGYKGILPDEFINNPAFKTLNLHFFASF